MAKPVWLEVGTTLRDPDHDQWRITSIGATKVELQNPDRGRHELLRDDLIAWIEDGEWER